MTTTDKTAILVFSRFANEEANEKKYAVHVGKRRGTQLASQLIDHTLQQAKFAGFPVYKYFSDKQKGENFGQRLSNSIEEVYSFGYSNVIIIGTDCPSITADVLISADKKLTKQDLVIGPSKDGGVYLIGIRKEAYSRAEFLSTPWLSANVAEAFSDYAARLGLALSFQLLEEDIDDFISLLQWTKTHLLHPVSFFLTYLLSSFKKIQLSLYTFTATSTAHLSKHLFRGPPVAFDLF